MITARMLLDRMTPTTILALLRDMSEAQDDQDDPAVLRELLAQLDRLVGRKEADAMLVAAGLEAGE